MGLGPNAACAPAASGLPGPRRGPSEPDLLSVADVAPSRARVASGPWPASDCAPNAAREDLEHVECSVVLDAGAKDSPFVAVRGPPSPAFGLLGKEGARFDGPLHD